MFYPVFKHIGMAKYKLGECVVAAIKCRMLKLQVGVRRLVTVITQTLNTLNVVWCLLMPRATYSLLHATKG